MNIEAIKEKVFSLVETLARGEYGEFMQEVDLNPALGQIWVEDKHELMNWLENNGCDVPESDDGEMHVTMPSDALGKPWNEGWLRIEEQSGTAYVEVELALNGEWTDFHIFFEFISGVEKPRISFVGIP